jgi:hypothetical protein
MYDDEPRDCDVHFINEEVNGSKLNKVAGFVFYIHYCRIGCRTASNDSLK